MTTVASRARDYVALMDCSAGDGWMDEVRSQTSVWLRQRQIDIDLTTWGDHSQGTARLKVRPMDQVNTHSLFVELVEDKGKDGTYTTELLAHDEPGTRDWVRLSVHHDGGKFVDVPRLAKYLMQVLPLGDRTLKFTDHPQRFGEGEIPHLISLLEDAGRHGLVFVAGTGDEVDLQEPFAKKLAIWTKQVYGLAQVILLDRAATAAFATTVPAAYSVPPWTIRTYTTAVDFGDRYDWRRHRILGTPRLGSRSDHSITRLLGEVARQHATTRPTTHAVQRVLRRLDRLENARLTEALKETQPLSTRPANVGAGSAIEQPVLASERLVIPPAEPRVTVSPDLDQLLEAQRQIEIVRASLGVTEVSESELAPFASASARLEQATTALAAISRRVETLQGALEEAQDERESLKEDLELAEIEIAVTRLDVDDRDGRIRWLLSRLKGEGDYEAEYLTTPDEFVEARPANFAELLDRVAGLNSVHFTGKMDDTIRLESLDRNGLALQVAWDCILAMTDYVRARQDGWDGSLKQYLQDTPAGYRNVPPGKFAESETGITMRLFGGQRIFPVPKDVDPSGRVEMKAHFKLARIGMASPRMYILDGHPLQSCVYIGYIGTHLTNTHTN